jgi:hypothetical protein
MAAFIHEQGADGSPPQVGSFDPFLDDSVQFAARLYHNGVPCRLRVGLPASTRDAAPA